MATPLLDWIEGLLRDPEAREAFMDHPDRYADEHGFGDLSSADVHDALSLIADDDYPSPRHWNDGWDDNGHGAHYLRGYLSDNYREIERHDTDIDNSVHQDVDTGGRWGRDDWDRDYDWNDHRYHYHDGDFHQIVDNDPVVASGNGAVAAGGDIEDSTITTGSRNVVGDDNQVVSGDENTTSFGWGDVTSADLHGTRVDDGGAVSIDGSNDGVAYGHSEDNDTSTHVRNSGDGDTVVNTAGSHGYAEQDVDQGHDDDSSYSRYVDNSSRDSHNHFNSHNESQYEDSHDFDVHH